MLRPNLAGIYTCKVRGREERTPYYRAAQLYEEARQAELDGDIRRCAQLTYVALRLNLALEKERQEQWRRLGGL